MCCVSGRVSFHCQNLLFSLCCSFNSLCVKFVVHEEHNVVLFQPSEKDPPQKPMTALNKPAKRPSLLPLTHQTPLKQLLSRAAVTYLVTLLPVNLSPSCARHQGRILAAHHTPDTPGMLLNPSAPGSSQRRDLRAPRSAHGAYCGLISSAASPGKG